MEHLSFNDVLIAPCYSEVESRADCDTSSYLGPEVRLDLPVIASNMDTVCESEMCIAMQKNGGIGVLHRNMAISTRVASLEEVFGHDYNAGIAIGIRELPLKVARHFLFHGAAMLVVDVAHGHSKRVGEVVEGIVGLVGKGEYDCTIVAGNVATAEGAAFLANCGVDVIKVGIGPGAACITRTQTGIGVPQLSAIMDCSDGVEDFNVRIIADGGIKTAGDVCKAIAAGADAVMLGGMLAKCIEAPGEVKYVDGVKYKQYRGMASAGAGSQYIEGAEGWVECNTDVGEVMTSISHGLRSAMSYTGSTTIKEFKDNAQFVQVSTASVNENGAHGF